MTTSLDRLRARAAAVVGDPDGHTPIPGVKLHAARAPAVPTPTLFRPTLYVVVQGAKRLQMAGQDVSYRGGELVVVGDALPALVQVTEAPYLSVEIAVDRTVLGALAASLPSLPGGDGDVLTVRPLPADVVDAVQRLLQLMSDPVDARVLGESATREVLYRVLRSPGGDNLLRLVQADSVLARIGQAADWMHDHLHVPVRVEHLARRAGMSPSTFHRSFRSATGTSPGRYHKLLRLYEARRLVALRSDDLARIAATVGYASPSQFSRDYKRAFGLAPMVDAKRFG